MPGLLQRIARLGRPKHEPARQTVPYARLQNIFSSWNQSPARPIVKATPANLRRFSKSVYCRRAIKTIKDSIATREWEIAPKDGVELNSELQRQIDQLTPCFQRPNDDDSFRSFLEQLIEDICVTGAGSFEQQIGGDKIRPLWMWPVDALTIQIVPSWNGEPDKPRYFQSLGYGNIGTQQGKSLRNDELVYIRNDPTTESPFGIGFVEVAFATINRQLAAAENAGNIAGNVSPLNVFFFEGADETVIATAKNFWRNEVEGQGNIPMFGGVDFKAVPLRGNDDKSVFLLYQELLIREIACASGLSPQNFSVERDVNRDTAEVSEDRDWRQTIIPMATLVESYVNREVIESRMGYSQIRFRFIGMDREDELANAKIYEIRYKNNSIVPNEDRKRRGEDPMDNAWGEMTYADMEIAVAAARGTKVVDDPDLADNPAATDGPKSLPAKKNSGKSKRNKDDES